MMQECGEAFAQFPCRVDNARKRQQDERGVAGSNKENIAVPAVAGSKRRAGVSQLVTAAAAQHKAQQPEAIANDRSQRHAADPIAMQADSAAASAVAPSAAQHDRAEHRQAAIPACSATAAGEANAAGGAGAAGGATTAGSLKIGRAHV